MALLIIPLLDMKTLNRLKCSTAFLALLGSAILLKYDRCRYTIQAEKVIMPGIILSEENGIFRLKLNLKGSDTLMDDALVLLRKSNPDIKIIEISETTWQNNTTCRLILNDFIIDECVIDRVTSVDSGFRRLLLMLRKENIQVTVKS